MLHETPDVHRDGTILIERCLFFPAFPDSVPLDNKSNAKRH